MARPRPTGTSRPTASLTEFPLPNPASGPTTIALAQDGTLWFTESAGQPHRPDEPRRHRPEGVPAAQPDSSPRIIALGSDGNMWFSEHTGNRMGRITPDGTITEFPIPTPNSMPRAIALGADGNIWFGEFARRQDRPHHAAGRRSPSSRFRRPTAVRARSPPDPTATSGSRSSTPARSAASRRTA